MTVLPDEQWPRLSEAAALITHIPGTHRLVVSPRILAELWAELTAMSGIHSPAPGTYRSDGYAGRLLGVDIYVDGDAAQMRAHHQPSATCWGLHDVSRAVRVIHPSAHVTISAVTCARWTDIEVRVTVGDRMSTSVRRILAADPCRCGDVLREAGISAASSMTACDEAGT